MYYVCVYVLYLYLCFVCKKDKIWHVQHPLPPPPELIFASWERYSSH